MRTILELQERRSAIAEDLMDMAERPMNDAQKREFDKLMEESEQLKRQLDAISLESELRTRPNRPPRAAIGIETPQGAGDSRYSENFRAYLRTGERRDLALTTATQTTGTSVLVSQDFSKQIEQALLFSGSMLKLSKVFPTATGAPLPWPTTNDTAVVAEIVGEGTQVASADPTLSSVVLGAFKYSTKLVKVSLELLQDSNFPLEQFLAGEFGRRLGRKLNTDFTVGAGTTEPFGLVTQSTLGRTAVGSATNTGGSENGTNTIGSDDLLGLIHSVDPLYRPGGVFQAHDSTIQAIMSVKDKYGRPLFQPPNVGQPASIFGFPIYPNNDLDQLATGKKTVLFGDHSKYVIRQVKDLSILRLVERFADYGQVGFLGFARFDGNLLDAGTHPVKFLQMA
jgi:HK97 family phage major capsid protein